MKIVLATHQFLPEFSAGTEILTYETAKELKRRGHDVEVWTGHPVDAALAKEKPFDFYEYDGIAVHRYKHNYWVTLPGRNVMESEYNNALFAGHFREYLKKTKPDMVHFFHLSRLSPAAIDVCLESGVPSVFTPTDFWIICPLSQLRLPDNGLCPGPDRHGVNCIQHIAAVTYFKKFSRHFKAIAPGWLCRFLVSGARHPWWPDRWFSPLISSLARRKDFIVKLINRLDRVLVPSRLMENILVQNGVKQEIFTFIPFGLNLKNFENMPSKIRNERVQIGFIGTLGEYKGAHILLEAVKLLPNLQLDIKIYGKLDDYPDYVSKLKKISEGDKRVRFCGTFPNEEIGRVFSRLDVLVVPSLWYENTPLVIYSAFAAKTPVIATNLGGMSEVVKHEVSGLLFEKGDSKGLSILLKRVVEDRSLLDRLAKNIAPPMSISGYVDGLEEVYREILAKRRVGV